MRSRYTKDAVTFRLGYDLFRLNRSDDNAGADERGTQGEERGGEGDWLHDGFCGRKVVIVSR